jgi:hypothetical protein
LIFGYLPAVMSAPLLMAVVGAVVSLSAVSQVSAQQVLYDINFDNQGLGVVATGPAPAYVSSVLFGVPGVVTDFSALQYHPLRFDSIGEQPLPTGYYYTQICLTLAGARNSALDLAYDFVDVGPGHFFTVLFDTNRGVRNFVFYNGEIAF